MTEDEQAERTGSAAIAVVVAAARGDVPGVLLIARELIDDGDGRELILAVSSLGANYLELAAQLRGVPLEAALAELVDIAVDEITNQRGAS